MKTRKELHRSFNGCSWVKFQLHELVEVFQQICDPDFAQLPRKFRQGRQMNKYI